MQALLKKITQDSLKTDIPDFSPGDSVSVHLKVVEGNKERVQVLKGVVIARRNGQGHSGTFTVRKVTGGIGVERTFFLHSPAIAKITVDRHGRVRRAKLYYLRDLSGKATRIKEKRYTGKDAAKKAPKE